MKQAGAKIIVFLRCYQSLIAWGICVCLVVMTFFQLHLPGDIWIIALMIGLFAGHLLFFYAGTMFLHCDRKIKLRFWTPEKIKKGDL